MILSNKNIRIFSRKLDNSNIRKQDNVCYRYASYIYALQAVNSSSIKVMNRIFFFKRTPLTGFKRLKSVSFEK